MKNHINRTIQDTIITALQAYQPWISDEGRFPDEAEKEYNKNFEAKCNKTGINLLAESSDADVAEAIDQVKETRRKAQKELDALIETKSRYDHQIEIGDPWNWKWEESWHPLAVERHKQTIKNANLAITALQSYQPTTRKNRTVEEAAISKTETTSNSCWYCKGIELHNIKSVKTVTDESDRELGAYDTPYNFCPNCGRKLVKHDG